MKNVIGILKLLVWGMILLLASLLHFGLIVLVMWVYTLFGDNSLQEGYKKNAFYYVEAFVISCLIWIHPLTIIAFPLVGGIAEMYDSTIKLK